MPLKRGLWCTQLVIIFVYDTWQYTKTLFIFKMQDTGDITFPGIVLMVMIFYNHLSGLFPFGVTYSSLSVDGDIFSL